MRHPYIVSVDPATGTIYLTDSKTAHSKVNLSWHILARCATLPAAVEAKKHWEQNHRKLSQVLESLTVFD